jgi:tripartite-type tricarboxylate transporter receptor subunit TctC
VLNDFEPISALTAAPFLFCARRTMPENNLPELISRLKTTKTASIGIVAAGPRLWLVIFQKVTGTQLTIVPYRGLAPARQDLVAGQIDLLIDNPENLALLRAGSIKAYAVTSETRLASAPDIPTFSELGLPALSWSSWYGLFAPRGTARVSATGSMASS